MIKVRNLTKNYGNHLAVKGISFDIEPGKIICPGCGKLVDPKAFCAFCGTKLS